MTHSITIETPNEDDLILLKVLMERLGLSMTITHNPDETDRQNQLAALRKFAGSWEGAESAEELEALIYASRKDQSRDVTL